MNTFVVLVEAADWLTAASYHPQSLSLSLGKNERNLSTFSLQIVLQIIKVICIFSLPPYFSVMYVVTSKTTTSARMCDSERDVVCRRKKISSHNTAAAAETMPLHDSMQCEISRDFDIKFSSFTVCFLSLTTSKKHFTLLHVKLMRGFTSNLITSHEGDFFWRVINQ